MRECDVLHWAAQGSMSWQDYGCKSRRRVYAYAGRFDFTNPNPGESARLARECDLRPVCGCHAPRAPTAALVARHEAEVARRTQWCVRHGLEPTMLNLAMAPGDDSQFVYGVKPWTVSGLADPRGQYSLGLRAEEREEAKKQAALWHEEPWICTLCAKDMGRAARAYEGDNEPFWWYWCDECRVKNKQGPKQEDPRAQRLDGWLAKKRKNSGDGE